MNHHFLYNQSKFQSKYFIQLQIKEGGCDQKKLKGPDQLLLF